MTVTALPLHDPGDNHWHIPGDAPVAPAGHLPDGTDPGCRINWAAFPPELRGSFKRAGWALITLPIPVALLKRAATSRVGHPSAGTIAAVTEQWRRYATWLAGRSQHAVRVRAAPAARGPHPDAVVGG